MDKIMFGTATDIKPGAIVKHFKGNFYYIQNIVMSSEDITDPSGDVVIYQALYPKKWRDGQSYSDTDDDFALFSRNLKMFSEEIDRPEYGFKGLRFTPVKLPIKISKAMVSLYTHGDIEGISTIDDYTNSITKTILLAQNIGCACANSNIKEASIYYEIIDRIIQMYCDDPEGDNMRIFRRSL